MKMKFIFLALPAGMLFNYSLLFASPPAPMPLCRITGLIKSVDFKEAYDEPCLNKPGGCPTDIETHHSARYFLNVRIDSAVYVSGDTDFDTCKDMYPAGKTKNIFINMDKVKTGDVFLINQKIEGTVRSFWGASFDSYKLRPKKNSKKHKNK